MLCRFSVGRKERHCSFSPIAFKALLTLIVSTWAWKVKVKSTWAWKVKVKMHIHINITSFEYNMRLIYQQWQTNENKTLKLTSTQTFIYASCLYCPFLGEELIKTKAKFHDLYWVGVGGNSLLHSSLL